MVKSLVALLCQLKSRPYWLFLLALFILLLLFLLRAWLNALLWFFLAIIILFGLVALVRLAQSILKKLCWKLMADPKGTGSENHPPSKGVNVPPSIYKRPDPMIYSQYYLMGKGLAVTWDNPDIQLFDGPLPVSSHDLSPGKGYTIKARIYNGSTEAAAVNMRVRFYYLSFGIGTVKNYIGQTLVDVPVKGAAGLPAVATCPWVTPSVAGHYCIQAELVWSDDANPDNNVGQENVDVKKLNSPNATFQFMLRNDALFARRIHLQADSYAIPPKEDCPPPREKGQRGTVSSRQHDPYARHRPASHPAPPGWQFAYLNGHEFSLEPGQEQPVSLKVTAFDGFVGRQVINVNAFDGTTLLGGVTLYAHS